MDGVKEEVRDAVFELDSKRVAKADGFSGVFCYHCWDLVAQNVVNTVKEFFVGVSIPKSIASALIMLFPKKEVCSSFADYRPINLCTFINKVFTKVLSNRLRPLLPSLISRE